MQPRLTVSSEPFGATSDGREVDHFTLTNEGGIELSVITYGGVITSVRAPDRTGRKANVVLGFDRLSGYALAEGRAYFGAIVGRYANRIANASRLGGNLVYAYAALRALIAWKPARFTIAIGDQRTRMEGYSVVVANNKAYGGGMYVAPDAELEDGEFDLVTIADMGKLRALGNLMKVFKGTHVRIDEVQVVRAARLSLSASRPFAVYADGEHLTDLPADLRVIPHALRVLVPPAA